VRDSRSCSVGCGELEFVECAELQHHVCAVCGVYYYIQLCDFCEFQPRSNNKRRSRDATRKHESRHRGLLFLKWFERGSNSWDSSRGGSSCDSIGRTVTVRLSKTQTAETVGAQTEWHISRCEWSVKQVPVVWEERIAWRFRPSGTGSR
jgi:hypothetical protein